MERYKPRFTESQQVLICSYGAATCSTCVGYPLDTIKTRLQTFNYPNFWNCITSTYAAGGIGAFYRGIAASILSASTARAFTMSVYNALLPMYSRALGLPERTFPTTLLGGMTAGGLCTLFTCPFEFAKVASQVEALVYKSRGLPEPENPGTIRAIKDISKRGSILKLYGGYRYHLCRDALGSGIYFAVYEQAKKSMSYVLPADSTGKPNPLAVAIAGGLCGVAAWVSVYPIDTMKSEYQRDLYNHSLANSLEFYETIVRKPRFKLSLSMYRGLGFSILRTSLNGMVLFSCYEYFIHKLSEWSPPQNKLQE